MNGFQIPVTLTTIKEVIRWTSQPQEHAMQLSGEKQLAFCLSCCERLEPNWRTLAHFDTTLDAEFYRTILDTLWWLPLLTVTTIREEEDKLKTIIADVRQVMKAIQPKTDGSHSFWYQIDYTALASLHYIASYLLQNQWEQMVKVVSNEAIEIVSTFVGVTGDSFPFDGKTEYGISIWEYNTPIVQQEVYLQMVTINYLHNLEQVDEEAVKVLKTLGFAGIQASKRGVIF
jgi:uncharacterized protein YjaG (DUF416 family)